jgi:hypothetical protein
MQEAHIEIYAKQIKDDNLFNRFKKISQEDSVFINIFIDEGFNPVVNTETPCPPRIQTIDGFVLVEDEMEFRDDWDEIDFDRVKCAIQFDNPPETDRVEFKHLVKTYFEQVMGFIDDGTRKLSPEKFDEIARLLKPKLEKHEAFNQSVTGIGDLLPDGRRVIQICGGEYGDQVQQRLSKLDPSILVPKKLDLMEICY